MRLGERRGEEFVAAGFPRRAVAVFAEPFAGAGVDEGDERGVAGFRPVAREKQREGDVEMGADAQGVGELGQESVEARGESERERFERGGPGGVMARGLGWEREEPGAARGGVERSGGRGIEER